VKLLQKDGGEWHLSYEDGHRNKWTISLKIIEKSVAEKIAEVIGGAEVAKFHNGAIPSLPSVQKVFFDWLAEKEVEVAVATLQFYRQTVNEFIRYLGARSSNEISEVIRRDIVDYRSNLAQRLTPKTINHRLKTLRSIFQFALRERYITENPASFVKSIKNNAPRARRPFTLEEVRSILAVANPEWQSLIKFGLYTGQRLGDLARLTWQSIDLISGVIILTTRKTDKRLVIPIAGPLLAHLQTCVPRQIQPGSPLHPKAYKAVAKAAGHVATLSNQFADILALAGLRRKAPHHIPNGAGRHGGRQRFELSFHSLRHTSVTLLKEAGVPQAVVMELIGHDSPEISQHYTHVGLEALKKACAALPAI
jgi:integrase